MPDLSVTVLDDGRLQLFADGVWHQPLTIEAVQALADRLPDARNAAGREVMTAAVRGLTDMLLTGDEQMAATITVSPAGLSASVDAGTFDRMQDAIGAADGTGALHAGPVTVRRTPDDRLPATVLDGDTVSVTPRTS